MNLKELYDSDRIEFETIAGSNCYGLNVATSDEDIVGIYSYKAKDLLKFDALPNQVSDEKTDIKFFELKEAFTLLLKGSPNLIEMLYIPERFHKQTSPLMQELVKHRDMFISLKCYFSFVNYAFSQIKKAKGQNKWINNPKPKEAPKPTDYMYWIPTERLSYSSTEEIFACRPVQLPTTRTFKVARIEHGFSTYRLYFATAEEDFFKSGRIECSSISKEEEKNQFAGVLSFNEVQYKQDTNDWKNYWGWIKKRNDARWVKQESGELDYDCYVEKETEFLTNSGWKKFDDISDNDMLGTLSSNNELVYQNFTNKFDETVIADFYTYENSYTRFSVTGNHRLYFSDCHRSKSNNYSTKYVDSKANWNLQSVDDYFKERKSYKHIVVSCKENKQNEFSVSDDYIKLLGMYLSDGSIMYDRNKNPKYVTVSQLEGNPYCSIVKSISSFSWSESMTNRKGRNECTYLFKDIVDSLIKDCGTGAYNKHLPNWTNNLSKRQFDLLFDTLIKGDGYSSPKGHKVYYSNSIKLIDGLQILCFQNGLRTQVYKNHISDENKTYQLFISKENNFAMAINKKDCPKNKVNKSGWTRWKGEERIVCFSVPNSILVTRNDDKIAVQGNCKNMMHCMRLLKSGLNILKYGEPKVFFEGPERDYLLDIRNGKLTYEDLMIDAELILGEIEKAKEENILNLDKEPNRKKVVAIYEKLRNEF